MTSLVVPEKILENEQATQAFGRSLASLLKAGDTLYLSGNLGTGKTTLARTLIRSLTGPQTEVQSPTFTLVQLYDEGPFPIWHVDLYRLESPEEILELGLLEEASRGLLLIEWPDRLHPFSFKDPLEILLTDFGSSRKVVCKGSSEWKKRLKNEIN